MRAVVHGSVQGFAMLTFLVLTTPSTGADHIEIAHLIEQASRPEITILTEHGREIIDRLLNHADQATRRQKTDIRLIQARNVALAGDYHRGIDLLSALIERDIDPDQHVRALELLANMLLQIDRYYSAFTHLQEAMERAAKVESAAHRGRVYSLAAYWYSEVGERTRGRELADLSEALASRIENPWEACVTLEKVVLARRALDEPLRAKQVAERAVTACREAGDPVFISAVTTLLGKIHHQLGETRDAEARLLEGMALAESQGYVDGWLVGRVAHARMLVEQQQLDAAEELLAESIEEMEARQRWRPLQDARYLLGEIARLRGDHESAHRHLTRYLDAHDRYLQTLRSRAVAFQEVRLGARAREQELQLLREQEQADALVERARNHQVRLQRVVFGLITLLVIALVLLIIHAVRERRHFRKLSRRDSLTGLRNHTSFFEAANLALQRCQNMRTPLTLVLADIDHFKRINDTHGHLVGDDIIRRVATLIEDAFCTPGITGRIGGEEFAMALPGMDSAKAVERVEHLRDRLRQPGGTGTQYRVTISFGIAEGREGSSIVNLRQAADDALYTAKDSGRDSIVCAGPEI